MPAVSTPVLTVIADTASNIAVSWTVASTTGISGYTVNSSASSTMTSSTVVASLTGTGVTSYTYTAGTPGTNAYFTITANTVTAGYTAATCLVKTAIPKTAPGSIAAPAVTYTAAGQPILTWAAPATVGYSGSLTYQVSSNGGTTWTTSASPSTYTFSGLTAGTTYSLMVKAANAASLTSISPSSAATPYTIASAPQSVSAALSTVTPGSVIVTFKAPASNGTSTITGYSVTPSAAPTAVQSFSVPVADDSGNMVVTVTGLTANTSYTLTVKAINAAGSGTGAAAASIKTAAVPGVPTSVVATVASATSVSVSFTAPAASTFPVTSYTVVPYINGTAILTLTSDASSPIVVSGLSSNNLYTFKVYATNLVGNGAQSTSVSSALVMPIQASAPSGASYSQPSSTYANSKIQYSALALADAVVAQQSAGVWTIRSGGLTDTLTNIKAIQCTDASGLLVDLSFGTYGSRLSSGVSAARSVGANGDTVFVGAGAFIESTTVIINKALTVQGPTSGDPATIGVAGSVWNLYVTSHNVTLNNITVDYSYQSASATAGQYIMMVAYSISTPPPGDAPTTTVQHINNFACNSVVFTNPLTKGTDANGSLTANQRGIALNAVNNVTLNNCSFPRAFNFGISMSSCTEVTVTNSTFQPCGWAAVGIFPSAVANLDSYQTLGINFSDVSNNFLTASPLSVQPLGAASPIALPTQAVILIQTNSGAVGAPDYYIGVNYGNNAPGSSKVTVPSSMDYIYISDPTVNPDNAGTKYVSAARYVSSQQYLESYISQYNGLYGFQNSTETYIMESRFNPVPLLTANNPHYTHAIENSVLEFELEADIIDKLADSSLSGYKYKKMIVISDDQQRSYIFNSNVENAVNFANAAQAGQAPPIYGNTYIVPFINQMQDSDDFPAAPMAVKVASAAPYTFSSDEYVASNESTLPPFRSVSLYAQSSADQDSLLSQSELEAKYKPNAPTIVSVVPGANSLVVTWTDNPGRSPTSLFNVTANGTTNGSVTSPYTITGLTNGTSYTVNVDAVNSYGNSSADSSGIPLSVPDAPTENPSTYGNTTLIANWTAPTNTGGSPITAYKVYLYSIDGITLFSSANVASTSTSHTFTELTSGLAYEWAVSATNSVGEGAQSSQSGNVTPAAVPTAPTSVSVTPGDGQAVVSWSPPVSNNGSPLISYTVYYNILGSFGAPSSLNQAVAIGTQATITGLSASTYVFTVTATNDAGESTASAGVNATLSAVPSVPLSVSAVATGTSGQVSVSWSAPSSDNGFPVTSYNIYQETPAPSGSGYLLTLDASAVTTSATLEGLTDGSGYIFHVKAVNANGESVASAGSASTVPYQQVTLLLSNLTQPYTGGVLSITAISLPAGAPIDLAYTGDHIQSGSYPVTASVSNPAYRASPVSDTLVIAQNTSAIIQLSNLSQEWTGSNITPTVTTNPSGLAHNITYSGNHILPGSYSVLVTLSDPNYSGSATDTLVITASPANAPSILTTVNITTPTGRTTLSNTVSSAMATAVSNIGNGADITSLSNNIVAAAFTSLNAALDADPPSAAGIATTTAATAAALLSAIGAGVAGVTGGADAVAAAATTIINQIAAANSSSLTITLLTACAAVSATKTNSSDANAIANGTALVTAFLNAYASQTVELTTPNDINALLANVSHSSTPSSVTLVIPDNNYIPLGDTAKSYYMPLVPGIPYRIVNSRGQEFNIVYSAQNNTISVGQFNPPAGAPSPTVYSVGQPIILGFDKYTLFAVGTGGFTAGDQTTVVSATATRSGTSATVSWVLPNLNFTIRRVDVIPTVNGIARASQRVSSGNSYTLSNLNSGDVVSFSVSMYDGELSSASLTSNTITVPTNNTVPCFPTGTRIATASGYKTVESLVQNELVLTSDGRQVPVKIYGKRIAVTDSKTAPYVVPKGSLGHNSPSATLTLSPDHAFLVRKGVWMLPIRAAQLSSKVKQIGVGEPVAYYHLECPNYLQDNLVVDGVVVESYAANQLGCKSPYTYSESLKGYTRSSMAVTSKSFSKA